MSSPLRLAVLGCGYVGTALCHQAGAAGLAAVGVVRSSSSHARLVAAGVSAVRADILAGDLAAVSGPFDLVVYAASAGGGGAEAYRAAYVDGVRAALAWAASVGARSFVFTSSTGVYRQNGDVDEASFAGGSRTADALVEGERLVLASSFATRSVLRLGGLYGPGRHYLYVQMQNGNGRVAGPSAHRINYVHRDDAASAALAAVLAPPGAYLLNVTDGHPVVKADLARWICQRLGMPEPTLEPDAPPLVSARRGDDAPPDRAIRATQIRERLGWRPRYPDVFAGLQADYPVA